MSWIRPSSGFVVSRTQPIPEQNPVRTVVLVLLAAFAIIGSAFFLALSGAIWPYCWELGALMGAWGGLAFAAALHLLWRAVE